MALPQKRVSILPHSEERRRHQRVSVSLLGRFMLSDRREFPCQVINMSPGGIALIGTGEPATPANALLPMLITSGGSKG